MPALAILSLFSACVTPPIVDDDLPQQALPEEEAGEREILSIPEAYSAISLSVQTGDPAAALAAYEEANLSNPDDPGTQVLLANLYLIAGELQAAEAVLAEVLAVDPENTDALYLLSLVRAALEDIQGQREILEQIISIDPDNAQALAALGELQLEERTTASAEASFQRAVAAEPENLVARVGLANVFLRQNRYEDAEEQLTAAIEIAPDYSFAYSDRARARVQQFELGEAEGDLTAAIELEPDYYWHYIDRGRVRLERRRYSGAAADFSEAIAINPDRFVGYLLRARALDANDELEQALSDYQTALAMRPDYTPAYAPTGVLYYMTGDYEQAADLFLPAFEEDKRRVEFALLAALALQNAGAEERARRFLLGEVNFLPRESIEYEMMRYYIEPANEALVLNRLRDMRDRQLRARMYFYLGAQLELRGRAQTAQAAFLQSEAELQPGFVEHRLASWRLRSYGSEEGAGQ